MNAEPKAKHNKGKKIVFHWEQELNQEQKRAVEAINGPLMVLAGAGSGKTRVIAYRIAYLIASRTVRADKILALTFTNKAADEMKQRVLKLIHGKSKPSWIGTFHSIFARILRREARLVGFTGQFKIYDETDQLHAIKDVIKQKNLPTGSYTPREILNKISFLKSRLITHTAFAAREPDDFKEKITAPIFTEYAEYLKRNNSMDFDDLLLNTYLLFNNNPAVLAIYQKRFKYILVDEFQDTNLAQYRILLQLADQHQNICVVGDDDQSIYRWRGAEIKNILQFEHDFDNTIVIRLEQNYRSTKNILRAAHSVIINNRIRHDKELWTSISDGEKLTIDFAENDHDESQWVARTIASNVFKQNRSWGDFAVLYRYNAQSRLLEEYLRRDSIPYTIVSGHKFYDRKEIKDVVAYLSILTNPDDAVSLKRIINYPPRGIGKQTVAKLEEHALQKGMSLFSALKYVNSIPGITQNRTATISEFFKLITRHRKLRKKISIIELVTVLIEETRILQHLEGESGKDSNNRVKNVKEFLRAIGEYAAQPNATLESYLSEVALITDVDTWDDSQQVVSLMTVHSSKGLEFPVVFITGLEEGVFHAKSAVDDIEALEEERRLFYVASTRAQESLNISAAKVRGLFGEIKMNPASQFISELDPDTVYKSDYKPALSFYSSRKSAITEASSVEYDYEPEDTQEFRIGMKVAHPNFGAGIIKSIYGTGNSTKLTILFQGNIMKKILVQYASLTILSD